MYCAFCSKSVVGSDDPVTVVGVGTAHDRCLSQYLLMRRIFKGIDLTDLSDDELSDIEEMIKLEKNSRNREAQEVELF